MDMLMNWVFGEGPYMNVTSSPYYFNAAALIKDNAGKIIGARFECVSLSIIADVPIETIRKAYAILEDPVDDADMYDRYLSSTKLSRSSSIISPWNVPNCTINLVGLAKGATLPSIPFKEGFIPNDKEDGYEGYTSFICPNMVFRIPLLSTTLANIEAMNYILYKTDFFQIFGIAEVTKLDFVGNNVICEMRSYKLEDQKFEEAFSYFAYAFCTKYGLPKGCVTNKDRNVRITFGIGIGLPASMKHLKYDASEIPTFSNTKYFMGRRMGFTKELGFNNVVYQIPDEETGELFDANHLFKDDMKSGVFDQDAALLDTKNKTPAFLRKYYRLNDNTFLALITQVPRIEPGIIKQIISGIDNAIYSGINNELLEDCLEWTYPVEVKVSYSGGTSKSVVVTRKLEISDDSFGEENKDELKNTIANNFIDIVDYCRIDGFCHVDDGAMTFTTKYRYPVED